MPATAAITLFRRRRRDPVDGRPTSCGSGWRSTGQAVASETVTKLQTPQVLTLGKETEYGLGWMVRSELAANRAHGAHASRSLTGAPRRS